MNLEELLKDMSVFEKAIDVLAVIVLELHMVVRMIFQTGT